MGDCSRENSSRGTKAEQLRARTSRVCRTENSSLGTRQSSCGHALAGSAGREERCWFFQIRSPSYCSNGSSTGEQGQKYFVNIHLLAMRVVRVAWGSSFSNSVSACLLLAMRFDLLCSTLSQSRYNQFAILNGLLGIA